MTKPKKQRYTLAQRKLAARIIGSKGGYKRAENLTSERRTEIARNAANARHDKAAAVPVSN